MNTNAQNLCRCNGRCVSRCTRKFVENAIANAGISGTKVSIGINGNWFLDGVDTGIPASPTTASLAGIQAELTAITSVNPTTFIPFSTAPTNNNPNLTINIAAGQVTANVEGTYLVNWSVVSDNDAAIALTLNGNVVASIAPIGSYLITVDSGDIIALMNVAGGLLNVTYASLNVSGIV